MADSDDPSVLATQVERPSSDAIRRTSPPPLGPRYELRVEIARGGMGRVVEATDTLLGRTVAI